VPYLLVVVAATVGAIAYLWFQGSREVRLVRSVRISAPVEIVFDLVSQIDRMPEWRLRRPDLPRSLRTSALSCWGEQIPTSDRMYWQKGQPKDLIQFRTVANCESGYRHASRAVRYESVFRITPLRDETGCHLSWDVRFQLFRPVDVICNQWLAAEETGPQMEVSLQAIRNLAESVTKRPAWQKAHLSETGQTGSVRVSLEPEVNRTHVVDFESSDPGLANHVLHFNKRVRSAH
jgi:Polyketide cyclase / dehydrase and lipid transport